MKEVNKNRDRKLLSAMKTIQEECSKHYNCRDRNSVCPLHDLNYNCCVLEAFGYNRTESVADKIAELEEAVEQI